MILVQGVLLKVALDHRSTGDERVPFAGVVYPTKRPFNFWQWRPQRPYVCALFKTLNFPGAIVDLDHFKKILGVPGLLLRDYGYPSALFRVF